VGCIALCLYFFLVAPITQLNKMTGTQGITLVDFQVFYIAGKKALFHHTVYDVTDHWQYKYSPLIAYLFGTTICRFDYPTAQFIFTLLLMAIWPLLIWAVLNAFERDLFKDQKLSSLEKLGLVLFFYGNAYLLELSFGQVNWIPFALLFLFFNLYSKTSRSENFLSYHFKLLILAILWSLAIQVKLYSLIIGAYLFFRKEFKIIALTALVTFGLDFLLLAQFHDWQFAWAENLAWVKTLTSSSKSLLITGNNGSLLGLFSREPYIREIAGAAWIGVVLYYLGLQYTTRNLHPLIHFALNLLAILLLNPLVWNYWTLFSIPAFLLVIHALSAQNLREQSIWIKITFLLLILNHLSLFTKHSRRYGHPIVHVFLFILFVQILFRKQKAQSAETNSMREPGLTYS